MKNMLFYVSCKEFSENAWKKGKQKMLKSLFCLIRILYTLSFSSTIGNKSLLFCPGISLLSLLVFFSLSFLCCLAFLHFYCFFLLLSFTSLVIFSVVFLTMFFSFYLVLSSLAVFLFLLAFYLAPSFFVFCSFSSSVFLCFYNTPRLC